MAIDPIDSKRIEVELRMEVVDKLTPSPEQRAQEIWQFVKAGIPNKTNWDLLCFCTAMIAQLSMDFVWLQDKAKELNKLVYTSHYFIHDPANGIGESNNSNKE